MITEFSLPVWVVTVLVLAGIVLLDLAVIARRKRTVQLSDALGWVTVYVSLAALFALGLFLFAPSSSGSEFVAGYITEYSLSVDNLFVFVIIMARFSVPALAQDKALYIGIVTSLVLRAVFITAGAGAVNAASWVFYLFGALLLYTAVRLIFEGDEEAEFQDNAVLRLLRRLLPISSDYDGTRLVTRTAGRRVFTPLIIVVAAIGIANVVFALDSIPAIFGLTHDAYIVFTANAFALMGLRQLFFLVGDLLERLVYLNIGLAVILAFIGVKLVIEALFGSHIHRIGSLPLPHIGIVASLAVIVATLALTSVASLAGPAIAERRRESQ